MPKQRWEPNFIFRGFRAIGAVSFDVVRSSHACRNYLEGGRPDLAGSFAIVAHPLGLSTPEEQLRSECARCGRSLMGNIPG